MLSVHSAGGSVHHVLLGTNVQEDDSEVICTEWHFCIYTSVLAGRPHAAYAKYFYHARCSSASQRHPLRLEKRPSKNSTAQQFASLSHVSLRSPICRPEFMSRFRSKSKSGQTRDPSAGRGGVDHHPNAVAAMASNASSGPPAAPAKGFHMWRKKEVIKCTKGDTYLRTNCTYTKRFPDSSTVLLVVERRPHVPVPGADGVPAHPAGHRVHQDVPAQT